MWADCAKGEDKGGGGDYVLAVGGDPVMEGWQPDPLQHRCVKHCVRPPST